MADATPGGGVVSVLKKHLVPFVIFFVGVGDVF